MPQSTTWTEEQIEAQSASKDESGGGGIRVLIANARSVTRAGVRSLLEAFDDVAVVGEASSAAEAVAAAARLSPDVVILDLAGGEEEGYSLIATIANCPKADANVLVLTHLDDPTTVFGALLAGAKGYLLDHSPAVDIHWAIRRVHRGDMPLDPCVTAPLISTYVDFSSKPAPRVLASCEELSPREQAVVLCLVRGDNTEEIASALHLSQTTIKTHIAHILTKWDVRDRLQLVIKAYETGFIRALALGTA